MQYKTQGVCARIINFDVQDGIVKNIEFVGGCSGNGKGVSILANDRPIDEVISLLSGVQCRMGTSCPDQLAKALVEYKAKN